MAAKAFVLLVLMFLVPTAAAVETEDPLAPVLGEVEEPGCNDEVSRALCESVLPSWLTHRAAWYWNSIVCYEYGSEVGVGVRLDWDCVMVSTRDAKTFDPVAFALGLIGEAQGSQPVPV